MNSNNTQKNQATISLNLYAKYFLMIYYREKPFEYRQITPYWCTRLLLVEGEKKSTSWWKDYFSSWKGLAVNQLQKDYKRGYITRVPFQTITFDNGYGALDNRPIFEIEYLDLEINFGISELGAKEGEIYLVLKLGKIISKQNIIELKVREMEIDLKNRLRGFYDSNNLILHNEWLNDHKGKYVITGLQQGNSSIVKFIGKVVQVRLEAGMFGSNQVLLRHADDSLIPHENQNFYLISDKYNDCLDKYFSDVFIDDSDEMEYSILGENHEKGFIIPSKVKEGESTPLRDIKMSISKFLDHAEN